MLVLVVLQTTDDFIDRPGNGSEGPIQMCCITDSEADSYSILLSFPLRLFKMKNPLN